MNKIEAEKVKNLERSVNEYSRYMDDIELAEIEYELLGNLLNLFLSGDKVPEGRLEHLDRLISIGEKLLPRLRGQKLLDTKCQIALGEAYKEKSMMSKAGELQTKSNILARQYCDNAIENIKKLDHPDADYLRGIAYRHKAVTFELEGDKVADSELQKQLFKKWQTLSSQSAKMLKDIGEDTVQSYALMNLASSFTRFCDIEVDPGRQLDLLNEGMTYLKKSVDLLRRVEDHRGVGWAYCHLCQNACKRLDLCTEKDYHHEIRLELEEYAVKAISELRQVEDHVGQGWGSVQLGVALYHESEEIGNDKEKLIEAERTFELALKLLQDTGYYRGIVDSYHWLGKCRFKLWETTNEQHYLVEAIRSLFSGILFPTTGLVKVEILRESYLFLEEEINKML
jgi:tetratricopeptide (TPR) repeat protein